MQNAQSNLEIRKEIQILHKVSRFLITTMMRFGAWSWLTTAGGAR
jgi:hypothetical protein